MLFCFFLGETAVKSVGADIRIVSISKDEVSESIRGFTKSNDLRIEIDEELPGNVTNIRAVSPSDSCFKLWWKGNPQVIDWKISNTSSDEIRIETRFGFQKRYWLWIFGILSAIVFVCAILYELELIRYFFNDQDEWSRNLYSLSLSTVAAAAMAGIFLIFSIKSIYTNYDKFVDGYSKALVRNDVICSQKQISSNQAPPHILYLFAFVLIAATIFFITYGIDIFDELTLYAKIIILSALCIVLIFSVLVYFMWKNVHFHQRLMFALFGIAITIPIIIFYTFPFIIPKPNFLAKVYNEYAKIEHLKIDSVDSDLEHNYVSSNFVLNIFFFYILSFGLLVIVIAGILVIHAPRVAHGVIRWKKVFFSGKYWTSYREQVVDFSGYARPFSFSIFFVWITISLTLYIQVYMILSISEFCITGRNIIFISEVASKFCGISTAITGFYLSSFLTSLGAEMFARTLLLLYSVPMLWIIFKVIEKRIRAFAISQEIVRKYSINNNDRDARLIKLSGDIADYFCVKKPHIAIVPSKLPTITAKYIGIPYFRSYIILSKGCLNRNDAELGSLLAHEIYHIKRHTAKWYVLNLLSDITLFGNGFLTISTNSYAHELEADEQAAKWAKTRGWVPDLVNALEMVYLASIAAGKKNYGLGMVADNQEPAKQKEHEKDPMFKKLKRNIDLLFDLYFGEEIPLSYIHPPIEERIERIKAVAGK